MLCKIFLSYLPIQNKLNVIKLYFVDVSKQIPELIVRLKRVSYIRYEIISDSFITAFQLQLIYPPHRAIVTCFVPQLVRGNFMYNKLVNSTALNYVSN